MTNVERAGEILDFLAARRDGFGVISTISNIDLMLALNVEPAKFGVAFGQANSLLDIAALHADLPLIGYLVMFERGDQFTGAWEAWLPFKTLVLSAPKLKSWSEADIERIRNHLLPGSPSKIWEEMGKKSDEWLTRSIAASQAALRDYMDRQIRQSATPTDVHSIYGGPYEPQGVPGSRRVIKTGRTKDAINAAARSGLRPLVKLLKSSNDIQCMFAVFQDLETGMVRLSGDWRDDPATLGEKVIDYTGYYPYHFPSPFAAYLIPPDLSAGEEVWLEDLIEDLVAVCGNQGYQPRLPAAAAIWNGVDFEILFDPIVDAPQWIG